MAQSTDIGALIRQLDQITEQARELETRFADELAEVHPEFQASARNLVAYVALRHTDFRELQDQLAMLGLASLGRAERNVMASINSVRKVLARILDDTDFDPDGQRLEFEQGDERMQRHVNDLLGGKDDGRNARIMVTLPGEAADDYSLVHALITAGMGIARINCAHDGESAWLRMIENIRKAEQETGRGCRIVMDLAGPKLRTGDLRPGPGVVRIRPKRDSAGRVVAPRKFRFVPDDATPTRSSVISIPIPRACIDQAEVGDRIGLRDARGRKRKLKVVAKDEKGLRVECYKTAFIATRTKLKLRSDQTGEVRSFRVGKLPPTEEPILLRNGDRLVLHKDSTPGEPAVSGADGSIIELAHISCRQPEVFDSIAAGDPIRLNDGKIEGVVESVSDDELLVRITGAKILGSRLRGDKGISFPDSEIQLQGLTEIDKRHLAFVAENADAVSMSFVKKPQDILALQEELAKYSRRSIGIIAKIETVRGFEDLPRLLLTTMRSYPAGVMIARGDLAVESGWERLAEIQEEMLWICEAAQVPVIWATQVLEQKTRKGQPSRAEITDAAMSQRADCVMLNKGPYILAAIRMLDSILRRMQDHQHKKMPKLRKLSISDVGQ